MTIIVNQELCTGCGMCVEACPSNAISLIAGTALIDQEKCSSCQICTQVCPTGALQFSNMLTPEILKPLPAMNALSPRTTTEISPEPDNWKTTIISVFGQYFLPRLAEILATFIEQRFLSTTPKHTPEVANTYHDRPNRRHKRRHGRMI